MRNDWNPTDPVSELGGSVLPQVVSDGGGSDQTALNHATVVTSMSGGADEDDGMPKSVTLLRKWAKHGTEVRRVYVQLTDAETDALTMIWRLIYPKPGEEREPFATPDAGEWEYTGQVFRHVKALLQEYTVLLAEVRELSRALDRSNISALVAIRDLVGDSDEEALRMIRDKLLRRLSR